MVPGDGKGKLAPFLHILGLLPHPSGSRLLRNHPAPISWNLPKDQEQAWLLASASEGYESDAVNRRN